MGLSRLLDKKGKDHRDSQRYRAQDIYYYITNYFDYVKT